MKEIVLAVSYRAEQLEKELKAQEKKVCGDEDGEKSPRLILI